MEKIAKQKPKRAMCAHTRSSDEIQLAAHSLIYCSMPHMRCGNIQDKHNISAQYINTESECVHAQAEYCECRESGGTLCCALHHFCLRWGKCIGLETYRNTFRRGFRID